MPENETADGEEFPTIDEEDLESEKEQTWSDEYEDKQGESTVPLHHGPGITIQRYRCKVCGHNVEREARGTAYDDLPPVHHNQFMLPTSEEENKLPLEEFLERTKLRHGKGKAPAKKAKAHAPKKHKKPKPAKKAKKHKPARKQAHKKGKSKKKRR